MGQEASRRIDPAAFPPFRERLPWIGGDLQTAGDFLFVPPVSIPSVRSERLFFPMADGTGDVLEGVLETPAAPGAGLPLAVVIHGLTGCEDSKYVRRSSAVLVGAGYRVLRLNLRGAGPTLGKCREAYHSGRTADLKAVLEQLLEQRVAERFVLMGFSLGGNLVLKGLAEFGDRLPIVAGISISAPIDLAVTARNFDAGRNKIYQHWMLERMRKEAFARPGNLSEDEAAGIRAARTVIAFDDALTAPHNGYRDAAHYYAENSANRFMADIPVPTLVIHGLNDPWIPGRLYRDVDWSANPNLVPLLPTRGGHVGFHEVGGGSWVNRCTLIFLDQVLAGESAGRDVAIR